MIEIINKIRQDFDSRLESISDSKQLEHIRIDFLGKKGQLQSLMKELRNASPEENWETYASCARAVSVKDLKVS